jgi:hypothetical protein
MKRNLVIVNTNRPKKVKVPMDKKRVSKYGNNKVSVDSPKFPLAGPGINPVAPPFPLDLKDAKSGEKSPDASTHLPPAKEKKVKDPKPDSVSTSAIKVITNTHDIVPLTPFDPDAPIDFSTIPPPFDYKDPWQLAKD